MRVRSGSWVLPRMRRLTPESKESARLRLRLELDSNLQAGTRPRAMDPEATEPAVPGDNVEADEEPGTAEFGEVGLPK